VSKVVFQNMVSLDGFFEGPHKWEIDWHTVGEEFNEFAINALNSARALIFGGVTYQGMAGYWPSPEAVKNDPVVAGYMNSLPKIVFSRTLEKVEWSNTRQVKSDVVEEIARLKAQPGKDLLIFGSAELASPLIQNGLIDEFRIFINPIVLGQGTPLFKGIKNRLPLKLVDSKIFMNGLVLLVYQPAK
jgi:dihydrofolate reductase